MSSTSNTPEEVTVDLTDEQSNQFPKYVDKRKDMFSTHEEVTVDLTDEQSNQFPKYVDKWKDIAYNCDVIDKSQIEQQVADVYAIADLPPPKKIIFTGSPMAGMLVMNLMEKKSGFDPAHLEEFHDLDYLMGQVSDISIQNFSNFCYGQFDASWLAIYDFFRNLLELECCEKLQGLLDLASNSGWFFPLDEVCIVTDKMRHVDLDDMGRLHSRERKAIQYTDEWGFAAVNGVVVDDYIIEHPEQISVNDIHNESNAEIKRLKLEQMTAERYIKESDAKVVHQDFSTHRTLLLAPVADDEDVCMVKVTNATAEPDGHYKDYYLRVPPTMTNANDAVAWTFKMNNNTYAPQIQT